MPWTVHSTLFQCCCTQFGKNDEALQKGHKNLCTIRCVCTACMDNATKLALDECMDGVEKDFLTVGNNTFNAIADCFEQIASCISAYESDDTTLVPTITPPPLTNLKETIPMCDLIADYYGSGMSLEINECLETYPSCWNETHLFDLDKCLDETANKAWETQNDWYNKLLKCYDPILYCVDNISPLDQAFSGLPTCIQDSALELTQCFIDHTDECGSAMSGEKISSRCNGF